MSDAPERTWVQWPHVNGAGLAFSCNARPPARRTEYIRADLHAARIAELEAVNERLREALERIRELNMTGADEDGHRWANSDLIEQEIVAAVKGETP